MIRLALRIIAIAGVLLVSGAHAMVLITEEEAARPKKSFQPVPQAFQARPALGGPKIEFLSPNFSKDEKPTIRKPVSLKVSFASDSGADIAMDSLKVTYLAFFDIDITDRLRPYIKGNQILADEADIPVGEHSIRIDISDTMGRPSREIFNFIVRP